ncbi:uncharacterized protein LOC132281037 [Cornus florida]|uniref:uncharacterized protein LOC132281037 n=1 Tax=Cornus florida TaxID=4283 RepID=UPI002897E47E|nr:uncharacterized protein LOC132281037 [Cornus florida]
MWNPNTIDLDVVCTTKQAIHCSISIIGQNITFYSSFIYGSNYAVERLSLWNDINHQSTFFCNSPWLILGDFNTISNSGEKNGGSTRWNQAINDFCKCLQQAELEDLRYNGILFTWNNKSLGSACITKKLDRALINKQWNTTFPRLECTFLTPGVSDHSPIFVTIDTNSPKRCLPFRFFNAWCSHPLFLPSVQSAWNYYIPGTAMFQVVKKLKSLKHILKTNCKVDFSEMASKIQAVKTELDSCQHDLDLSTSNIPLRMLDLSLTKEYTRLSELQESMLRQKSRMVWLKLGDSNSSYFHKSIASKVNKRKIYSLTNADGLILNDTNVVVQEIVSHFQNLFGTSPLITHTQAELSRFITKSVPPHFHSILESMPSYHEIQSCMLSLNRDKSPGPDGFNAVFFHQAWAIIGRSTIKAISEFFRNAFVQGRKISDSILLTHELLRGYHRDASPPRCAIKINLMKAFDSVKWDFTLDCLSHLNFPQSFIKLIQNIISRAPRFKYHWRCKELGITHLSFADDLFLFCHGDITSVSILKCALDHFCTISGLSINLSKSSIFFSGVDPYTEIEISNMLGIGTGSLPIRHLGVLLISTSLKAADCRPLIERITHRITHWSSRSLSYAGRLQLIKSMLVSTQVYWSSIFILPKGVIDELNRIFMAFLWSGIEMKSTKAKIAWMTIYRSKEADGLDIPNLVTSNQAAITRYIWDLLTDNTERVWIKWCKTYLIKGKNFWALEIPQSCSWSWRKILQQRHHARQLIKHKIGKGTSINLWLDNWLPAGPLSLRFPPNILIEAGLDLSTTVSHLIYNDSWNFPPVLSVAIPELPTLPSPSMKDDKLIWTASPSGEFSLKHTAASLFPPYPLVPWFDLVWRSPAIPRMKFNLWLAIQDRLPTLDRRQMATHNNVCFLCNASPESHSHLFFSCDFTSLIWSFYMAKCRITTATPPWPELISTFSYRWSSPSPLNLLRKLSLAALVYHIWEERNARIFCGKRSSQNTIQSRVSNSITSILKLGIFRSSIVAHHILKDWDLPPSCCRPPPRPPD